MSCIIPQLGKKGKIISADFRKYSWKRKSSEVEKTPAKGNAAGLSGPVCGRAFTVAGAEPAPVFTDGFPSMLQKKPLANTSVFAARFRSPKICSMKLLCIRRRVYSPMIFAEADAALLTQGKDNKTKSAEKGRRQTVRVRLPSPYRNGASHRKEGNGR
jgi:hypothetical protein